MVVSRPSNDERRGESSSSFTTKHGNDDFFLRQSRLIVMARRASFVRGPLLGALVLFSFSFVVRERDSANVADEGTD